MFITRLARVCGTASVLVMPVVAVMAQTQLPTPAPQNPPAATQPQASPPAAAPQASSPMAPAEKKAAAPVDTGKLVGLSAKSSDDHNLGTVHSVMEGNGKSTIGVKVGGFLGFGGHLVALPDGKFNRVGDTVQVNMTADEIQKLPQAVDKK
jgi:hypothetical protein